MTIRHAAVWIDHHEARIFDVADASFDVAQVNAPHAHLHRHPKVTAEHEHPADAQKFFHEVAHALASAEEILVLGPSTAKLELIKHVHKHDAALAPKIIGVETVDHPTDGQIVAYARKYFHAADRMKGTAR
jgi:stalled ribosome rescue protein Dom34